MFSLPFFEQQLVLYVTSDDKSAFDNPFDISKIPIVTREQADAEDRTKKLIATTPTLKAPKVGPTKASGAEAVASATAQAQRYAQELLEIPEMKEFGSVLKSSPLLELTEAETEYVVTLVKHIFKEHIVLQYEVKNTLPDTVLENVSVVATPSDEEELEEVFIIQAEKLPTDQPGKVYVAFKKINGEGSLPISTFSNILRFTSKEIDPSTNEPEDTGYDDEYEVAEFDLAGSDYVIPTFAGNFSHIWEQVGASGEEATETLQLSGMSSIAGTLKRQITEKRNANQFHRGYRATHQGALPAASGGHGCPRQPDYSHAQAPGQDCWWWPGSCHGADGILFKNGCDDQDHGAKRGGERGCAGCRVGGLSMDKPALRIMMYRSLAVLDMPPGASNVTVMIHSRAESRLSRCAAEAPGWEEDARIHLGKELACTEWRVGRREREGQRACLYGVWLFLVMVFLAKKTEVCCQLLVCIENDVLCCVIDSGPYKIIVMLLKEAALTMPC